MLKESLIGLMANKSIHKISIREICDRAQINRTTFYKYYGSQYDLLKEMENEALTQVDSYLGAGEGNNMDLLTKIVAYIHDNLNLCRLLINNAVNSEFAEKLFNLPKIKRLLSEQLSVQYNSDELDYMYQFVVNGGFSIIKRWINKDQREAPERIAVVLVNALSRLF